MSTNTDVEKCAACPNESECAVWGTRVCYPCAADWSAHSPTHGDIATKYGADAETVAIYRAFTERWLAARKGRAA